MECAGFSGFKITPHDFPIRWGSKFVDEVDVNRFKDAFALIAKLTVQTMLKLCEQQIDGGLSENEIVKAIRQIDSEDSVGIDLLTNFVIWLTTLNEENIRKLLLSASDLQRKTEHILDSFRTKETRNRLIEISESVLVLGCSSYRLEANAGAIFLRNIDKKDGVTEVMSAVQFLSTCKDQLQSLDLSGMDLRGLNLSGLDLSEVNFDYCDLSEVKFYRSDLSRAKMRYTKMNNTDFFGANLQYVDAYRANFCEADLRGANFYKANMRSTNMNKSLLGRADFSFSIMDGANLQSSDASWTNFQETTLVGAKLNFSYLAGASFSGANLARANLANANLSRSNFCGAELNYASLEDVKLVDTKFDHTTMLAETLFSLDLSEDSAEHTVRNRIACFQSSKNTKLFTTISKIGNRFEELKLKLASQVMISLREIDLSNIDSELLERLVHNPGE
ncbi:MAG: endoribonuclease [Solimicrobium sp.]|jgi:uncharacterized protein YjbI with pentapeptide repeats|nr:endoribonuclease [Solimicrobium sp.]